jgi:hypothetical protein
VFAGSKKAIRADLAKKALPEDFKTRHREKKHVELSEAKKAKVIKRIKAKMPARRKSKPAPAPAPAPAREPEVSRPEHLFSLPAEVPKGTDAVDSQMESKAVLDELRADEVNLVWSRAQAGKKALKAMAFAYIRAKLSKHVPKYISQPSGATLRPRECANCRAWVFPNAEVKAEGFRGFTCSAKCMLEMRRKVHCHECFVSCSTSPECFLLPEKRITKLPRLGQALFACSPMCMGGVLQSDRICTCKVCDVRMIVPRYASGIVACSTTCADTYVDRRNEYFHVLTYWLRQPEQAELRGLYGAMGFAAFRDLAEAQGGPMDPFYGRGPSRFLPFPMIPWPVNDPIVLPTLFRQPRKARDMYVDKLVVFK